MRPTEDESSNGKMFGVKELKKNLKNRTIVILLRNQIFQIIFTVDQIYVKCFICRLYGIIDHNANKELKQT